MSDGWDRRVKSEMANKCFLDENAVGRGLFFPPSFEKR